MLLQAALNGARTKAEHPSVPLTGDELARDAMVCVTAGAGSIHLHPRDDGGRESFDPEVVDRVVREVRAACSTPVCVTTGAWIEPNLSRRLELIGGWTAPDLATVNMGELGSEEVIEALLQVGVGIEAGVWSVEDAERLAASGLGVKVSRILVEPVEVSAAVAAHTVATIHATLDGLGLDAPRLQHGDGDATWILIRDAVRRGIDTRVGLEDTLLRPDGTVVESNEELVLAARELGAG